jgi:hypothetical protein
VIEKHIKDFVQVYSFFGMGCAMMQIVRALFVSIGMPVSVHFLGLLFYSANIALFIWVLTAFHVALAFELVLPMLVIALWGAYWYTKQLINLVPMSPKV